MYATKTLFTLALALGLASAVPAAQPALPAMVLRRQVPGCPDGYYLRVDCNGKEVCQAPVDGCPEGYRVNPVNDRECTLLPC